MNIKQIILFILLTAILIVLSYSLLDMIDRHRGFPIIILLALVLLADIAAMATVFLNLKKEKK
jgi:hypothetical protein